MDIYRDDVFQLPGEILEELLDKLALLEAQLDALTDQYNTMRMDLMTQERRIM